MIKIRELKLDCFYEDSEDFFKVLKKSVADKLKINQSAFEVIKIIRYSIDARKNRPLKAVYTLVLDVKDEKTVLKHLSKKHDVSHYEVDENYVDRIKGLMGSGDDTRPIIVGMGPCGMFAALAFVKVGIKPIIIERGEKVENRRDQVNEFFKTGVLNPESNVQYGEGGAGTFSDGKLNTTVKDKYGRQGFILESFVNAGAPKDILFNSRPHIGTDYLFKSVIGIRDELIKGGAEIKYNTRVTELILDEDNTVKGVKLSDGSVIYGDNVILAIGHSSRDTILSLYEQGVKMSAKPFAVGVRIEHKREDVNAMQYKEHNSDKLPTAFYKLTHKAGNGRNVFSFCMCPGGYVVNASSEVGGMVVNGMSDYNRMADNSNSAIVVSVTPDDYPSESQLAGIDYQRELERKAYAIGNGKIPSERYEDFKAGVKPKDFGEVIPVHKGDTVIADLRECLPEYISSAIIDGIEYWDSKMNGYKSPDALLSGVESRTSSPVRIERDAECMSNIKGLYPCGEGAGYAGGIMSAAMDGLKVAEVIISKLSAN